MAKYDPLYRLLSRQKLPELELSFAEIERTLGAMLPNGAAHAPWWSNVPGSRSANVQCGAWKRAGYEAFLIIGKDRVRFRRAK